MSEESVFSYAEVTNIINQKEKEDENIEVFKVPVNLDSHLGYRREIKKIHRLLKEPEFDIRPSWDNLNIKETTADQLEMQIQEERILLILNRTIEKLTSVGFLPVLVANDGEILKKYMNLDDALYILDKYTTDDKSLTRKSLKKIKSKTSESSHHDIVCFQKILESIGKNSCIRKFIQKLKFTDMDEFIQELIRGLFKFCEVLKRQLNLTAEEEREKIKKFKQLYMEYDERKSNIKRLQEKLIQQTQETNTKLKAKEKIIEQYKSKIKIVRENFNERISDAVKASEKAMMIEAEKTEPLHQELADQSKMAQNKYNGVLEDHLENEKALRSKKYKVEAQLANWVAKYDNDIGERHNELEKLTEEYEAERAELAELECLFIEQEKIFNKYKKDKNAEDEAAFQERLYAFVAGRSAKIIQRAWRAYRARKLARKKARKERAKNKAAAKVGGAKAPKKK